MVHEPLANDPSTVDSRDYYNVHTSSAGVLRADSSPSTARRWLTVLAPCCTPKTFSRGYDAGAQTCANSIQTAQEIYWLDNDAYSASPSDLPDLAVVCEDITFTAEALVGDDNWTATLEHPLGTGRTFVVTATSID